MKKALGISIDWCWPSVSFRYGLAQQIEPLKSGMQGWGGRICGLRIVANMRIYMEAEAQVSGFIS